MKREKKKVPRISQDLKNYNNTINKIATEARRQKTACNDSTIAEQFSHLPEVDIKKEMLNLFKKEQQNEIIKQNEKFFEDLKNPSSRINFNI